MAATRHGLVDAHLGYAKPDELAHGKRYCAIALKVELKAETQAIEEAMVEWKAEPERKVVEAKTEPEPETKMTMREWGEHESKKRKVGEHTNAVGGMELNAKGFGKNAMGSGKITFE